MSVLSEFELGWLVGLLEGEGYFAYDNRTQHVVLGMTDDDIVFKAASMIVRLCGGPCDVFMELRDHSVDMYKFRVSGERARIVMRTVVPHMGYRRRQLIWRALNKYKQPRNPVRMPLLQLVQGA